MTKEACISVDTSLLMGESDRVNTPLDDLMDKIAQAMMDYGAALTAIVKDLPDEEFAPLVAELRRQAQPDDPSSPEVARRGVTKNFAMPEYDWAADHISAELGARSVFRRADSHFKATGEGFYCVHCGGTCIPKNHG